MIRLQMDNVCTTQDTFQLKTLEIQLSKSTKNYNSGLNTETILQIYFKIKYSLILKLPFLIY